MHGRDVALFSRHLQPAPSFAGIVALQAEAMHRLQVTFLGGLPQPAPSEVGVMASQGKGIHGGNVAFVGRISKPSPAIFVRIRLKREFVHCRDVAVLSGLSQTADSFVGIFTLEVKPAIASNVNERDCIGTPSASCGLHVPSPFGLTRTISQHPTLMALRSCFPPATRLQALEGSPGQAVSGNSWAADPASKQPLGRNRMTLAE